MSSTSYHLHLTLKVADNCNWFCCAYQKENNLNSKNPTNNHATVVTAEPKRKTIMLSHASPDSFSSTSSTSTNSLSSASSSTSTKIGVSPSSSYSCSPPRSIQSSIENESHDETVINIRPIIRSAFAQVLSIPMSQV